jgi:hypothetical protein
VNSRRRGRKIFFMISIICNDTSKLLHFGMRKNLESRKMAKE